MFVVFYVKSQQELGLRRNKEHIMHNSQANMMNREMKKKTMKVCLKKKTKRHNVYEDLAMRREEEVTGDVNRR